MFRAYDPERERLVAVKLFRLDLPPERVHQLVAEFEKVVDAQLVHPSIAMPLATGIVEASAYLAQEFLAAESLDTVVRERGAFSVGEVLRVADQLASAFTVAADSHIDHGGLHPRDVLLIGDQPKVTGFGVVRALERVGAATPVRRPYTAPERMAGGSWSGRADVFSLAAILCELLWGRRVAGAGGAAVDALGELPGVELTKLRAVLARALDEQPEARYESAAAFVEALKGAAVDRRATTILSEPPALLAAPGTPAVGTPALDIPHPAPDERRHSRRATPRVIATPEPRQAVAPEPKLPLHEEEVVTVAEIPLRKEAPAGEPAVAAGTFGATPGTEPIRTGNWPIAASLAVGLAVGFAGGFGVGMRSRPPAPAQPPVSTETVRPTSPIVQDAAPALSGRAGQGNQAPSRPATPPTGHRVEAPFLEAPLQAASMGTVGAAAAKPAARATPPSLPAPAVPAAPGRLQVRSTPSGAIVLVDGKEYGRTPLTVRALTTGAHRVKVVRDGFASEDRHVTITTLKPSPSIDVRLTRARQMSPPARGPSSATATRPGLAPVTTPSRADVMVQSKPAGANVFIDGKLVGTTPLSMRAVPTGDHAVRIEFEGYRTWSSSVSVKGGFDNKVTASLERDR